MDLSKLIVETFEKENIPLTTAIKDAVKAGETKANFERFMKRVFGREYMTSLTAQASMTCFEYYKKHPELL